jgi:hypothetical protein
VEYHALANANRNTKIRFIMKAIVDRDALFRIHAYEGLLQYAAEVNAMGLGVMQHRKYQFGKLLIDGCMGLARTALEILVDWRKSEIARQESVLAKKKRVAILFYNKGYRDMSQGLIVLKGHAHQHVCSAKVTAAKFETTTKLRETVIKKIMKTSVGQMTTALRSVIAHSQKSVKHEQLMTSRREKDLQKSVRHEQLVTSSKEKVFKQLASTTTCQQVLTFKV